MDKSHHVDTLKIKQRISLRTNLLDLLVQVPNLGAEFDIRKKNWNRWSVGTNVRWRPYTHNSFVQPIQLSIFEASLEGRQYWRERQATTSGYLKPHKQLVDKLFSCRNILPSHPKWIFYRGGYVSYSDYSLLLSNNFGRQGKAIMAGVAWGFVTPWIEFPNGCSIDFEAGISFGACYTNYTEYGYNAEDNCYPKGTFHDWHVLPYPVVKDLRVSLVYRIGGYPLRKKYRWRYDADLVYRDIVDSLYLDTESRALTRQINDSIYAEVWEDFRHLYDSFEIDYSEEEQEASIQKIAIRKLEMSKELDKQQKEKEKEKAERDSLKLEKKEKRQRRKSKEKPVADSNASGQIPSAPDTQDKETSEATERKEATDETTE